MLKFIIHFVNAILISIGYITAKAFITGYTIFDVGFKASIEYASTIFIESFIVSILVLLIIYFLHKIWKKYGKSK